MLIIILYYNYIMELNLCKYYFETQFEEQKKKEKDIRRIEEIKLYLYYLHLEKKISKKAFVKLLDMCCDSVY